jgi:hypothetical protein
MRRRRVLVLGGTVLLAGCGGDGDGGTATETDDEPTEAPADPTETADDGDEDNGVDTPTPEGIENRTGQDADVGGTGNFQPTVTYNSCTKVTVEADEPYTAVAIGLVDGTNEMHQDDYEGTTTFEADITIDEVLIWSAAGDKSNKINPSVDSCPGA